MTTAAITVDQRQMAVYRRNNFLTNLKAFLHMLRSMAKGMRNLVSGFIPGKRKNQGNGGGRCGGSIKEANLVWGGIDATPQEVKTILAMQTSRDAFLGKGAAATSTKTEKQPTGSGGGILQMKFARFRKAAAITSGGGASLWLGDATDLDFLRYLRRAKGKKEEAYNAMMDHSAWRTGKHGIDTIKKTGEKRFPPSHPLHREVFWLGIAKDNTATLVIRTQAHDGVHYNEDAQEFVDFIMHMLEKGQQMYRVGSERQVSLLLDRAPYVKQADGGETVEVVPYKLDMGVVPRLVELVKLLFATLHPNYADILVSAKVVPVSTFFSMCYRFTSRAMDKDSRAKFIMVKEKDLRGEIHALFDPEALPPHLGGTSNKYGPWELTNLEICGEEASCEDVPTVNPLE
jgi:hypothetical protein